MCVCIITKPFSFKVLLLNTFQESCVKVSIRLQTVIVIRGFVYSVIQVDITIYNLNALVLHRSLVWV